MRTYKRPLAEWIILIGFGLAALSGWQRAVLSVMSWYWLENAGLTPGPAYLAWSGALWGLVALVALVWVLLRRPVYRWVGLASVSLLAVIYWIDRLLVGRAAGLGENLPFAALFTLGLLAFTAYHLRPWRIR